MSMLRISLFVASSAQQPRGRLHNMVDEHGRVEMVCFVVAAIGSVERLRVMTQMVTGGI